MHMLYSLWLKLVKITNERDVAIKHLDDHREMIVKLKREEGEDIQIEKESVSNNIHNFF